MPQAKILVDTNTYLRLAQTIHPLLSEPFGKKEYCLYILQELNKELGNHKLHSKFHWIDQQEYVDNRGYFPRISRKEKRAIQQRFGYIWDYVQTELPGPSRIDVLYIATAMELNIPVVTDDQDMTALARYFKVRAMSTLKLLKIMLNCGHIDMKIIRGLCEYWRYSRDLPSNFNKDYQRLFPG